MDIVDDDSALIHSKFHKAKRGLLSSSSSFQSQSQNHQSISPQHQSPSPSIADAAPSSEQNCYLQTPFPPPNSSATTPIAASTIVDSIVDTEFRVSEPLQKAALPQQQQHNYNIIHAKLEAVAAAAQQHNHHHHHQYSGGTTILLSPPFGTNSVAGIPAAGSSAGSPNHPISAGLNFGGPPPPPPLPTIHPPLPMPGTTNFHAREQVFRFDSTDRERYLCSAISEEDEEVFSPGPSPSSFSTRSYDSPHIVLDSPRITISPLRIEDSPPTIQNLTPSPIMDSHNRLFPRVHPGLAVLPPTTNIDQARCLFGVPSSPVSPLTPNTPLSPSPLSPHEHMFQQGILEELYRRRCHSDSDLPCLPDSPKLEPTDLSVKSNSRATQRTKRWIPHPLVMPAIKSGSLESDQSTPQDSPLDLSMKGSRERFGSTPNCDNFGTSRTISSLVIPPHTTHGGSPLSPAVISPTTRHSVALRYNLEVSPVVEESRPGGDMGFVCPVCGQVFSLHDRLAKHMASRHKSKPHDPNKSYPCEVCHRSFARSDMLTRHVRLHTGVKPYTCKMCGQVFSRSDHLSTHQRTHTGEKPYKCPQCPYSACRRDMITRHLRTHTRNSSSSSSDLMGSVTTPTSTSSSSEPIVDDRIIKTEFSRPPSSSSSFAPESPTQLSPALNLGSLSVHSPPPSS
ncbi:putative zinc finger protein [Orchesella cincta]|uniref:Putative zinc finger protein n=1 Tax=Orchesella cincta TaxID=48709 RepID=A0A1D2N5N6_ORCCI|nr:putative zinc finger protein [Orchesella cincta]